MGQTHVLGPLGISRGRRGLEVLWKTSGWGSRTCTPDQDNSCWETEEQTSIRFNFDGKGRWQAPGRSFPLTCGTWKSPTRPAATLGLEEGPHASLVDSLGKLEWPINDGNQAEDPPARHPRSSPCCGWPEESVPVEPRLLLGKPLAVPWD